MNVFTSLILSLPTQNATVRMRSWRTLKSLGAGSLRDGVYLLPESDSASTALEAIANDVRTEGGIAHVLRMEEPEPGAFASLFDRRVEFEKISEDIRYLDREMRRAYAADTPKKVRRIGKALAALSAIDFFPDATQARVRGEYQALDILATRLAEPGEPEPTQGEIPRLSPADYQGQLWATRRRPWVDRLASAWLIARHIDANARFLWLGTPGDCPADALGFDFDGARFTHVGPLVSFEVLAVSFGLSMPGLARMAALIHFLDVGGPEPPEAAGVSAVLKGLRQTHNDDDDLIAATHPVFDAILRVFAGDEA
ncbi:chromate resistance protein ChrB domain-containing protein [Asticcacaulis sp. W401b]|uniref:chromate resistance protein ChrB domain-containing protein n=1 Tax=Asticcacaulis sp. W401b TaxID=3388666 RepID=UPI003970DB62